MDIEVWKTIPGYEGIYKVSDMGNVMSLKFGNGKILSGTLNSSGYCIISLSIKGYIKIFGVHQLVAMAFLGHKPSRYLLVVHHLNNIKSDNRLSNLEIRTHRKNIHTHTLGASKYKGVCWNKVAKKWKAQIQIGGKNKNLGCFESELEASQAYQNKLKSI